MILENCFEEEPIENFGINNAVVKKIKQISLKPEIDTAGLRNQNTWGKDKEMKQMREKFKNREAR